MALNLLEAGYAETEVTSPPAEEPLSLKAAKSYLRIGHDHEDELVSSLIQSARARLEAVGGLDLVSKTVEIEWDQWPKRIVRGGVKLNTSPVTALNAMQIEFETGETRDVKDQFEIIHDRIRYMGDDALPRLARGDRVIASLQVGYADADSLPDDLKEALLRLVGANYEARAPSVSRASLDGGLPVEVQAILDARKEVRL